MAHTPAKLYRMNSRRDEAGPQAVERRFGQQHKGFCHQRGRVHQHAARMYLHPDHPVGIDGAQGEHQRKAKEGRIGSAHGPHHLMKK